MLVLLATAALGLDWREADSAGASGGNVHPVYSSMEQGGRRDLSGSWLFWLGLAFGICQIALITALLSLAVHKPAERRPVPAFILAGGVAYAAVLSSLFLSYRIYAEKPDSVAFWLGFPTPTAWLVYGIWGLPWIFVAYFVYSFRRSYLRSEDLARFEELVRRRRQHEPGSG